MLFIYYVKFRIRVLNTRKNEMCYWIVIDKTMKKLVIIVHTILWIICFQTSKQEHELGLYSFFLSKVVRFKKKIIIFL